MPSSKHLTHGISNLVSLITKTKLGLSVPSLCTFLEILSGNGPEYDSDDINHYALPHMCYHIDSVVPP
jgi:hypothetical protein